jgi:hypothetical protein
MTIDYIVVMLAYQQLKGGCLRRNFSDEQLLTESVVHRVTRKGTYFDLKHVWQKGQFNGIGNKKPTRIRWGE